MPILAQGQGHEDVLKRSAVRSNTVGAVIEGPTRVTWAKGVRGRPTVRAPRCSGTPTSSYHGANHSSVDDQGQEWLNSAAQRKLAQTRQNLGTHGRRAR